MIKSVEPTQHTGTIFTTADVKRLARFLHNATNDSAVEYFNKRLRLLASLIRRQYADGLISKARAIDEMMCALANAGRTAFATRF